MLVVFDPKNYTWELAEEGGGSQSPCPFCAEPLGAHAVAPSLRAKGITSGPGACGRLVGLPVDIGY
jgi:hypothetical protein